MSFGILGHRAPARRRVLRGFGDVSNCQDQDLITCNQQAYDDASTYCDSISQSGDITCIQENMDGASACPCATVDTSSGGGAASSSPGVSFTSLPLAPSSSTAKKTSSVKTSTVKPGTTPSSSSGSTILGFPAANVGLAALAVVGYFALKGKT